MSSLAGGYAGKSARIHAMLTRDSTFQEVFDEFASALAVLAHWAATQGPSGTRAAEYAGLVEERKAELNEMLERPVRPGTTP